MIDISEINRRLNSQVESVCRHLLPNGNINGREWTVGSIAGEPGKSLKVCLSGDKLGVWADFAAGEGGDLIKLWCEVKGLSVGDALREIKNYLGIHETDFEGKRNKKWRKPEAPKNVKKVQPLSPVMKYLQEERKITADSIREFKVKECEEIGPWKGWKKQSPWKGPWIVLPFLDRDELLSIKYLHLKKRDGKKQTMVEANCRPSLFGWQALDSDERTVAICEGEIDCMTLYQYGVPALSVPFGGGGGKKQQWVECEWENLERFETIYLCMDMDREGDVATKELITRLGRHRCRIVKLPHKDANECLQKGVAASVISKCFDSAQTLDPEELKPAPMYEDAVVEEFYPSGGVTPGFELPWKKLKDKIKIKPGELSIWTGWSGHGKSLTLGQVMLAGACQGEKVCIASLEMHPRKTLSRITRQLSNKKTPPRADISSCFQWYDGKFWIFDLLGTAKADRIVEVFRYAYHRYGVKQFVVDSLMKCGIAEDDYNGQKNFIDTLMDFSHETGGHVHLVAHSRKGLSEETIVGRLDVRGGASITDLADNVYSIWRNKKKATDLATIESGGTVKGMSEAEVQSQPDCLFISDKQRDGGWEGRAALFFDPESERYYDNFNYKGLMFGTMEDVNGEEDWNE